MLRQLDMKSRLFEKGPTIDHALVGAILDQVCVLMLWPSPSISICPRAVRSQSEDKRKRRNEVNQVYTGMLFLLIVQKSFLVGGATILLDK